MTEWKPWFAWRPVELLTMEIVWLKRIERRPTVGNGYYPWSPSMWRRKFDYAWPSSR